MDFWTNYFCFGLLILVFGKNASTLPVSQTPAVAVELDKKESRKNSDTAMQCVLELIELMTSDYSELSKDCERIMNRLVDETSDYDVVNKKSDTDTDALKTLIEPKSSEDPKEDMSISEEDKRSHSNPIKMIKNMKNPQNIVSPVSTPDDLIAAKTPDEAFQPNFVDDTFEEEIKFGKPFMTSFNGVNDKFLIVPMRVNEPQDYMSLEDAKTSPDMYDTVDDLFPLKSNGLKDDDYLSDLDELTSKGKDDYDMSDSNLDNLARIWGNINPKSNQKDGNNVEEEKMKDDMLFDLEMDLEKLNDDLKSLKKP